jgi:hypothetical protein
MNSTGKNILMRFYPKAWLYWIFFLLLYFAYKFIPSPPLDVICGINESNFQHYKASFFSWIIVSIVEFIWIYNNIENRNLFFFSRLTTAVILPWFVFILWYLGIAVFGRMPSIPLEIVYANIITIIVGIFATIFEREISGISFSREFKVIMTILFLSSLVLYIVFTFGNLPWADVFVEPDWK